MKSFEKEGVREGVMLLLEISEKHSRQCSGSIILVGGRGFGVIKYPEPLLATLTSRLIQ